MDLHYLLLLKKTDHETLFSHVPYKNLNLGTFEANIYLFSVRLIHGNALIVI